ncbi:hypothetical protein H8B02_19000 [Bradyrhizobium sp. Pear77]|uniref:hypothetical protein n=1 Tax=Bradyrhizobium TaxID=374 RepID=UPI001E372A7F|nr:MULTISPECIES: hypothetical protein [Bradyrhizobium]MCC8955441.1 hypothetical protein [Bradyrhizobium altum]MCC8965242.1 hypothetical protein [Bradyrhizobium oropedii]
MIKAMRHDQQQMLGSTSGYRDTAIAASRASRIRRLRERNESPAAAASSVIAILTANQSSDDIALSGKLEPGLAVRTMLDGYGRSALDR